MNHTPHRPSRVALFPALLAIGLLLLGSRQSATAQTTLSKSEVDRMLYVSNAFDVMERRNTPELVALAFTINATYQNQPDYSQDRLLRELQNATARYNAYYRSALSPDQTRFAIAPYESIVYMLSILASLPGERDAVARQLISREAANFGSLLDTAAYLSEAIPSGGNSAPAGVFQSGSVLGLGRGQEFYLRYRKEQLYAMYDLAQSNATARQLIDKYFGAFFRASALDNGAAILAANPTFANSVNFQRIAPYFNWDTNSPHYGTLSLSSATLTTLVAGFQSDALAATQQLSTALTSVYNTYQRDYASYSLDPLRQQAATAALAGPLTAFNQRLAGLSGFANVVDLSFPSMGSDSQSKASAGLEVASSIFAIGSGLASGGRGGALGAISGVLSLAGSAMGFADAFGLGSSPPSPSNADLANGLIQLNQNLQSVGQDLANRMNTVDAHLIALYQATSTGFNTVLHDIAVVNAGISQIQEDARYLIYLAQSNQAQLYSLTQSIYAFFNAYNQDQRLPLRGYLATLDNVLRNNPDSLTYNDNVTGPFFYNYLRNYATLNAMSLSEVGSTGSLSEDYGQDRLRYELTSPAVAPEQTLNYLCGYADRLVNSAPYSLSLPAVRSPLLSSDLGGYLVNEPAWEMSMAGLLRLDAALPAAFKTATQNDGPANSNSHFGMRSLGRNLQRTAANATLQMDYSQSSPRYVPSPRLSTLLTDYNTKAVAFTQKLAVMKPLLPADFVACEAGGGVSMVIRGDGTVWAWGSNYFGQLGDGTNVNSAVPLQVNNLSRITAVSIGDMHCLARKADGTVWAWGWNMYGQLGDGTLTNQRTPIPVPGLTGVIGIAASSRCSLAVKSDGTVWAWGWNGSGGLGNNSLTDSLVPVQVSNLTNAIAVSAGTEHSVALKSDGTVWTWGSNYYGNLGNNSTTRSLVPVQVSNLTGVSAISGGWYSNLAVKSDGTVWAWGQNDYGNLGDGTRGFDRLVPIQVKGLDGNGFLTNVTAISTDGQRSLALKSDSTVWAWGWNISGTLGEGTAEADRKTPVQVKGPNGIGYLTGILAISTGYPSLAIKSGGTAWDWGRDVNGIPANNLPRQINNLPVIVSRPRIAAYIFDIEQRYLNGTPGTQDYTIPAAAELYLAFRDMQNSRTVLERFFSLGLSRSLAADTLPRALFYANATDPFLTNPVTGTANPNYGKAVADCQRLPDREWITALYADQSDPFSPDPADVITAALPTRVSALQSYLTSVLQNLADEANARRYNSPEGNVTAQLVLGEPLANVELMLRRFDAFTMTKATGTVRASDPNATPALRKLAQNGLSIQVALRNDTVAEPLLTFPVNPTASDAYTFYMPDGVFDVLFKAPGFLQRLARVNTSNSASATVNVTLIPGDIDGDNRIGRGDVAMLQRALGSVPMKRHWNPLADLNGDGRVDMTDAAILQQQFGRVGDNF